MTASDRVQVTISVEVGPNLKRLERKLREERYSRSVRGETPPDPKEPCLYPLSDGRRCLECATCQPDPMSWKVER